MHNYNLRRVSVEAMTILQLIICGIAFVMFFMGYKIGHRDGYLVGRKAVRKQYEMLDKVRA